MFKISLIITTYNREEALELVLLSVLPQTELPHEIIIADDGSGPATRTLISMYQKRVPVPLKHCWQADHGFRAAAIRNRAIAMATGDYMVIIDGDMVLHRSFISDHRNVATKQTFVQGKRVLLGEHLTQLALKQHQLQFSLFHPEVKNKLNALHWPYLARWLRGYQHPLKGIRSCNMASWRADIIKINGFNEDFNGWGREDSEFAARMQNAGIRRFNFKFGAIAYHLHHASQPQTRLAQNHALLEQTLREKKVWCTRGIDQYL